MKMSNGILVVGVVMALVLGVSSLRAAPLTVSADTTDPTPNPFTGGTWSAGKITLSGSYSLDNESGTFQLTGSSGWLAYLGGGGTLVNHGTVDITMANAYSDTFGLVLTNSTTFDNYGTLLIHRGWYGGTAGAIVLGGTADTLRLRNGSTLSYNANGFYGHAAYITGAGVVTSDGQPVNISSATASWGSGISLRNTGASDLNVGSLTLPAGTVLEQVGNTYTWRGNLSGSGSFSLSGNPSVSYGTFTVGAPLTVNFGEGFVVGAAHLNLNGQSFTNAAANTLTWNGSVLAGTRIHGGGALVNRGRFNFNASNGLTIDGGSVFDNYGTLDETLGGYISSTPLMLNTAADSIVLHAGSTLRGSATTYAGNMGIGGAGTLTCYVDGGGNVAPISIEIPAANARFLVTAAGVGRWNVTNLVIHSTSSLQFQNVTNRWQGRLAAEGKVLMNNGLFMLDDDLSVALGQGFEWGATGGKIDLNGHRFINEAGGKFIYTSYTGTTPYLFSGSGNGLFVNNGILIENSSVGMQIAAGATLANNGTISLQQQSGYGSPFYLATGGVFSNAAGGVVRNDMSGQGDINGPGGASPGKFVNVGTVLANQGKIRILSVDASQWYGANTLLAGTWSVASNGTVELWPGAGSSVSTIGSNATVIYQDGGTIAIQGANLRTTLTTVKGKLLVNGTTTYSTTASGLSVTNGGVLGGSGSISGNVSVAASSSLDAGASVGGIGTLSITGAVTLASGAGIMCDYNGTTGDTVIVNGTLTLPAAATVTTAGTVKPSFPITILSSTNLVAPGGVSGWTLAGSLSEEKLLIVGNTVVIAERLSGTVLICQ